MTEKNGANIQMEDSRVTRLQNWILACVGSGIIVMLGWLANSVDNLNRSFAGLTEWRVHVDRRLDNLERRP